MTPPPRVCVIIACFDAEAHLGATLDSVLAQTFRAWECIVVDDGSNDATASIADQYAAADARFRVVRQVNGGVSRARNTGLAHAGDSVTMVAFLDSDDVWTPSALHTLVAALDVDPHAVGAYGLAEYMDERGRPIRAGDHPALQADRRRMGRFDLVAVPASDPADFATLIVSGTIWPAGVALHRRRSVERAGRFDPAITKAEDWELYLRMSRFGSFAVLAEQVVWYRRHETNATATGQAAAMAESVLRVRWLVETSGTFPAAMRRYAARVRRRLAARWVIWTFTAGLRALRAGRCVDARSALSATARFAGVAMRATRPDDALVRDTLRYVVDRSAGAGSPLP